MKTENEMVQPGSAANASGSDLATVGNSTGFDFALDERDITYGGCPIAKLYDAADFPCRDEDKADEEHDAETVAVARRLVTLANERLALASLAEPLPVLIDTNGQKTHLKLQQENAELLAALRSITAGAPALTPKKRTYKGGFDAGHAWSANIARAALAKAGTRA